MRGILLKVGMEAECLAEQGPQARAAIGCGFVGEPADDLVESEGTWVSGGGAYEARCQSIVLAVPLGCGWGAEPR